MANAKLLYAHLADNVHNAEGNKLNIIGVFAGIGAPGNIGLSKFPFVYPRLAMAVGLSTTKDKLPIEVTFRDEDGKDIVPPFSGTFQIERQGTAKAQEAANINFNLNFDSFQITKAGKLFLTIESGGDELTELELNISQAQPPQGQQQQPPAK